MQSVSRAPVRSCHWASVTALSRVEARHSIPAIGELANPPLLIVGAPRSGTTLLQQVLVAGLDIAWFSGWHNVAAGYPGVVPGFVTRRPATHFRSRHGAGESLREPHEASTWWYRFFPRRPQAATIDDVGPASLMALRRSMAAVIERAGRPVLWKNVTNSVRMAPLLAAVPEAVVIHIRRDLVATAASLLRARLKIHGTEAEWWSVEPADIDALRQLDPVGQVVGQIRSVECSVRTSQVDDAAADWLEIAHQDLISDPRAVVAHVQARLERHLRLRPSELGRLDTGVPAAFNDATGRDHTWHRVERWLAEERREESDRLLS